MNESRPDEERHIVEVELTQQQDVILERLRREGHYGATDTQIIRNVFQEFLRQTQV